MVCSKCGGEWKVKRIGGFLGIGGKKRQVCSDCGYLDERDCWVDDVYVGPKDHDPNLDDPIKMKSIADSKVFFEEKKMPCCGCEDFIEGPSGGMSINILCANCGAKFNMTPILKLIERL